MAEIKNEKDKIQNIFQKIDSRNYDLSCCFLCGENMDKNNPTLEHVIPKWILNKYNLWDHKITLLNQTHLNYRHLTIPCCAPCNNNYLSKIESEVKASHEAGFKKFEKIDKEILYYWLGKIFYGIIYRELSLLNDRSNPALGYITSHEFLDDFKAHYIFLQGIRGLHKFEKFSPASIFIFKTQCPDEPELQWDFTDDVRSMFIAIRMGEIGIIAVLQDNGSNETMKNLLGDFSQIQLHPIQFKEAAAQIVYKSLLFNRTPKYISIADNDKAKTIQMPIAGLSSKPVYDDWDMHEYAKILSVYTGIPVEVLNPSHGKITTWMRNKKGKLNYMDIKKYPWP